MSDTGEPQAADGSARLGFSPVRVFVSYRRSDTDGHAGRLYDSLIERFGEENVFMDIDSIDPGADFAETIKDTLQDCDVVLALIGPNWLTSPDGHGGRRLDAPRDWVRLEIQAALKMGVAVIPVLVRDAPMPAPSDLPRGITRLARLQAFEIGPRWRADVARLGDAIETATRRKGPPAKPTKAPTSAAETGARPPPSPVLALSHSVIDVGDVQPGQVPRPEPVFVQNHGGGTLDWTVETTADWIEVVRHEGSFSVVLRPRPGPNRAEVVVRDRAGGGSRSVTVLARAAAPVVQPPDATRTSTPVETLRIPSRRLVVVIGIAAAALVVAFLVPLLAGGGDDGGRDVETSVAVPGRATWTDTGVDLTAGAQVTVASGGSISSNVAIPDQSTKITGPAGAAGTAEDRLYKSVIFGTNHAALLAKIGETGAAFPLTPANSFTADRSGRLFLGVNDLDPCNNGGEYSATIRSNSEKTKIGPRPTPITVAPCA